MVASTGSATAFWVAEPVEATEQKDAIAEPAVH